MTNDRNVPTQPEHAWQPERTVKGPQNNEAPAYEQQQTKLFLPGQQPASPESYGENTAVFSPPSPSPMQSPTVYSTPANDMSTSSPDTVAAPSSTSSRNIPDLPTRPLTVAKTAPLPDSQGGQRKAGSRALWWFVVTAAALAVAIVLAVVLANLLVPQPHPVNTGTTSTAQTNPTATPTPTPVVTATQPSTILNGVSIAPNQLNLQQDCQPDNGYRCTVTLTAGPDVASDTEWAAAISQPGADFHPGHGTIAAGQKVQVIIYVHQQCPYNAILDFDIHDQHVNVNLTC